MRKKSHPDAIATLDFLAKVASAYALVSDDVKKIETPATTWWNLPKIYEVISAVPEPRWVLWISDVNDGIWPAASDSELSEICVAMQSFPSGTLIINFKNLCDAREKDKEIVRLPKSAFKQYRLEEHNRHRADNNLVRLISEENKLTLFNAIAKDVQWYDAWLSRPDLQESVKKESNAVVSDCTGNQTFLELTTR